MTEVLIALLLCALVAAFVAGPLSRRAGAGPEGEDPDLADLLARKEAKYREIRDAELDHAQGKIGDHQHRETDAELRGQAIEILRRIDEIEARTRPRGGADR